MPAKSGGEDGISSKTTEKDEIELRNQQAREEAEAFAKQQEDEQKKALQKKKGNVNNTGRERVPAKSGGEDDISSKTTEKDEIALRNQQAREEAEAFAKALEDEQRLYMKEERTVAADGDPCKPVASVSFSDSAKRPSKAVLVQQLETVQRLQAQVAKVMQAERLAARALELQNRIRRVQNLQARAASSIETSKNHQ